LVNIKDTVERFGWHKSGGPQTLLIEYTGCYTSEQMRRREVKPSITGWAQVNGRNDISWERKFALDVWYVDHQSLWLDLKIIVMTVWKTLKHEGISQEGYFSSPEFMGTVKHHEHA
jgi:sugar transferase EpsL